MKKRITFALLAALMLLVLAACGGSNTGNTDPTPPVHQVVEPAQKENVYQLTEPGHLMYMAQHPDQKYALAGDIDMGGAIWTPVDTFSGTLTGEIYDIYNYTISNLTISVAPGDANAGFFRTVTGTVEEINFDNITITCSGTFSGNLGVVAGTCTTSMADVDVRSSTITVSVKDANVGMVCGKSTNIVSGGYSTGDLNVTLSGGTSYIGGSVGAASNVLMQQEARVNLNITGSGAGAAGGIVGNMTNVARSVNFGGKLNISTGSDFAAGALVGNLPSGGITSSYNCARATTINGAASATEYVGAQASGVTVTGCLTRDLSNLDENLPAAEQALRQKVVDYMYKLCTIRWIPTQDIFFQDDCTNNRHKQTYHAGQIYIGLPYGHDAVSLEKFMSLINADGTTKAEVYTTPLVNSYTGIQAYSSVWPTLGTEWTSQYACAVDVLGTDCADAVYWAWSQIEADMSYTLTRNMICINGMIPVGDYQVTSTSSTSAICKDNGKDVIYEAYAKLQMGDAVLNGPGHVRMAAEAAYVFRDENGKIDPDKSYLLIHEQGAGCTTLDKRHTTCDTNAKFTFSNLFKSNYIPITIGGFTQGADEIQVSTTNTATDKTGLAAGMVSSNYRLNWVTVQVLDANGTAVVNKKVFVENNNDGIYPDYYEDVKNGQFVIESKDHPFTLTPNSDSMSLAGFAADIQAANLTAGATYTYKVLVGVASQEVEVQSFQFTA